MPDMDARHIYIMYTRDVAVTARLVGGVCWLHRPLSIVIPFLVALARVCSHLPPTWDLDGAGFFAGVRSVTKGFMGEGFRFAAFDVTYGNGELDMSIDLGWFCAVELVLRTRAQPSFSHSGTQAWS